MSGLPFSIESLPMLKSKPAPPPVSLEEYLRFEAKSKHKHEFINQQIVKMPYARGPHNEISGNMIAVLKNGTRSLNKIYRVFSSDQKIYLPALDEGLYADVLAVCEKPLFWDDHQLLLINPLLIVEVLSRSTKNYDRGNKFSKYKTLESFREYVMIEQNSCRVETWFREEPSLWRETIVSDRSATIPLRSLGIEVALSDIYEHLEF